MIFEPPPAITLSDAWIIIYILTGIAAMEAGIIGGLATRVGSLRNLFRLTASVANKRAKNPRNKKSKPTDIPDS